MITSLNNERVKRVRALQSKRQARRKANRFVLEGPRLAREALLAGAPVEEVFYTEEFAAAPEGASLLGELGQRGATLLLVAGPVMQAMSDTQTPQGILAVLPIVGPEAPSDFSYALVIDGVRDPGNMGGIMRTAAAAGVPLMIVTGGTVDLTNPKVVRSAMGAHFRLPVQYLSWEGIMSRLADHAIFLAEAGHGAPYFQVDWTQRCALIVSEEAHGPSERARQAAHAPVTIPMPGQMESLNVAIATGILLFEMVRQRSQHRG
ncbi:MAG TPA: RNA methyltransferase [Chloroflexi bacterium]|nr:RNA methyltransferase [Chloroflexota bacterium]